MSDPWFRNPKARLTDDERWALESIRREPVHPAASVQDLPQEVGSLLTKMSLENYDQKGDIILFSHLPGFLVGLFGVLIGTFGGIGNIVLTDGHTWTVAGGVLLMATSAVNYWRKESRIRAQFQIYTDELLKDEWEIGWVVDNQMNGVPAVEACRSLMSETRHLRRNRGRPSD